MTSPAARIKAMALLVDAGRALPTLETLAGEPPTVHRPTSDALIYEGLAWRDLDGFVALTCLGQQWCAEHLEDVHQIRKMHLSGLARRHGIELPVMPPGDVTAILEAEQALVAAGIDPGDWDPDGAPT